MSKYHAIRTVVDGIPFASRKESSRYCELKLLERAGAITELKLQVSYTLLPKRGNMRAIRYIADFTYLENGIRVVEDVKGMKTQVYALKKRMMYELHGIEIREV